MGNAKKNYNMGGRPKLDNKVKKTQTLTARLTEWQYDWILQQAASYGLKPSSLLTECVRYTFECINEQNPLSPKFPDPDAMFGIAHDHQTTVWRKPLLTDDDKKALSTCDGILTDCHHFLSLLLKGLRHEERLRLFRQNPKAMIQWISCQNNFYNLLWQRLRDCGWPSAKKTKAKMITKKEVIEILSSYPNNPNTQKP